MNSDQLKDLIVDALDDAKGLEIVSLDVTDLTAITDYMVIVTGTSNRHVRSLTRHVVDVCREQGERPLGLEGEDTGDWVLLDKTDGGGHRQLAAAERRLLLDRIGKHLF